MVWDKRPGRDAYWSRKMGAGEPAAVLIIPGLISVLTSCVVGYALVSLYLSSWAGR